jgi:hypothetical protein
VVHAAECSVALSEKTPGPKRERQRTKTKQPTEPPGPKPPGKQRTQQPQTKQKEPEEHKPTQGKEQAASETLHIVARGSVH